MSYDSGQISTVLSEQFELQSDSLASFVRAASPFFSGDTTADTKPLDILLGSLDALADAIRKYFESGGQGCATGPNGESYEPLAGVLLDAEFASACEPDQVLAVWARYLSVPPVLRRELEAVARSLREQVRANGSVERNPMRDGCS